MIQKIAISTYPDLVLSAAYQAKAVRELTHQHVRETTSEVRELGDGETTVNPISLVFFCNNPSNLTQISAFFPFFKVKTADFLKKYPIVLYYSKNCKIDGSKPSCMLIVINPNYLQQKTIKWLNVFTMYKLIALLVVVCSGPNVAELPYEVP